MHLHSSHQIQSNPVDSSTARRLNNISRASSAESEEQRLNDQQQEQDVKMLRELRVRDREVRAHEAAHVAAAGSLVVSGPSFTFQRGPDGRSYAIGGEVQLDTSAVPGDPEATIDKAEKIKRAALAPAQPSPQDLRVAANANQLAARARLDLAIQRREEAQLENEESAEQVQGNNGAQSEELAPASDAQAAGDSTNAPTNADASFTRISSSSPLQSNQPPAAAISAFMATAESKAAPVRFNQFA